jgi:hypothetical protein
MNGKFKLAALAWGIAGVLALPAGATADSSAVCTLAATGNTTAADQCHQTNTVTNVEVTNTTGGPGGVAIGGVSGPAAGVGAGTASSVGGHARVNGGDVKSRSRLHSEQPNQVSGRDSNIDPNGGNNSAVCGQGATGNTTAPNQCRQDNAATNVQVTTTRGGNGGVGIGGTSGPATATGDPAGASSEGGDANASGGDAKSRSSLDNDQSNQISGRDSWVG